MRERERDRERRREEEEEKEKERAGGGGGEMREGEILRKKGETSTEFVELFGDLSNSNFRGAVRREVKNALKAESELRRV